MKVLLLNGSPRKEGCTYTALAEVAGALSAAGVETEIVHAAKGAVRGCIACQKCRELGNCVFDDDAVNTVREKMKEAQGLVIGAPVYYASPNGSMLSFLDRMFYAGNANFAFKPGAAIVSARRAGTSASLDVLNKYFTISNMPLVSSMYWNMVHGNSPEDVRKDLEGMQIMRQLGTNMAWLMKCIAAGDASPAMETPRVRTNFIQ